LHDCIEMPHETCTQMPQLSGLPALICRAS
jgi:hypothetical protein